MLLYELLVSLSIMQYMQDRLVEVPLLLQLWNQYYHLCNVQGRFLVEVPLSLLWNQYTIS